MIRIKMMKMSLVMIFTILIQRMIYQTLPLRLIIQPNLG